MQIFKKPTIIDFHNTIPSPTKCSQVSNDKGLVAVELTGIFDYAAEWDGKKSSLFSPKRNPSQI